MGLFLTDSLVEVKDDAFSNNPTWTVFSTKMSYQGLDKLIVDNGVFNNTPIESFKTIHGLVSKTDTDKQKNIMNNNMLLYLIKSVLLILD